MDDESAPYTRSVVMLRVAQDLKMVLLIGGATQVGSKFATADATQYETGVSVMPMSKNRQCPLRLLAAVSLIDLVTNILPSDWSLYFDFQRHR